MADDLKPLVVRTRTTDEAARLGLIKALRGTKADGNEWGGIVFQSPDGRYYAVDPVTSKNRYQVEIKGTPDVRGDNFAAIYHTHPSNDDSAAYFSEGDINVANTVKKPSYIGVEREDAVRYYQPGDKLGRYDAGGGRQIKTTQGRMILSNLLAGVKSPEERQRILKAVVLRTASTE